MRKIAITGPESTGKTTLAKQLAHYYHTNYVPEFARFYMNSLKRPYTFEDVVHIAEQQMSWEDQLAKEGHEWLFCDTDLWVIRIWLLDKFGKVPYWIEKAINHSRYDFYLLMAADLPWQADALREDAERVETLFQKYYQQLSDAGESFAVVKGEGDDRFNNALLHLAK